jgi:UDP-N-acetyl-D-glucosamine/UDP-N-acetyl-D-galactosamine dehydrogenase
LEKQNISIAVIGLGYVGLPVSLAFSKHYNVFAFDIDKNRVEEIQQGFDKNREFSKDEIQDKNLKILFTNDSEKIKNCNIFIITVPTPIDSLKKPDLSYLFSATALVGAFLKKEDIVIFESTVYPGCTEEDCVPILEKISALKYNQDFFCGYSPERINPGDKSRTFSSILKVTSGSTPAVANFVDKLYSTVVSAGTHKTSSIKVAEASKIIENVQRDINISLINELALIFDKMDIDTTEVLEAASTKWNFLKFTPGLVGGHCISVDSYYLLQKSESLGYYPQVILSGRRINDSMSIFVANKLVKLLVKKGHKLESSRVLILGITFKENCPDIRNSKVIDIYQELIEFGLIVEVFDPLANKQEVEKLYNLALIDTPKDQYQGIILAVAHEEFKYLDYNNLKVDSGVIFDVKSFLDKSIVDARL